MGANALTAAFYPTPCRTTGVSWALGVGRSGSIAGSLLGGAMLAQGLRYRNIRDSLRNATEQIRNDGAIPSASLTRD